MRISELKVPTRDVYEIYKKAAAEEEIIAFTLENENELSFVEDHGDYLTLVYCIL